jgi:hypothetical protein
LVELDKSPTNCKPKQSTTILRFTDDTIFDIEEEDYPIPPTESIAKPISLLETD